MASAGAKQRAQSPHGRAHAPDPKAVHRNAADLQLDTIEFRTQLLRPSGVKPHSIDVEHLIESISWRYEEGNPTLLGDLTLDPRQQWGGLRVSEGDTLKLDVKWFGRWQELWRMLLRDMEDQLASGVSFALTDPLVVLQESLDDWHFAKTKRGGHPNGWRCHDILKEVARRYRIPVGKVAKGKRQIHSLVLDDASPLQVIQRAYALEKSSTGHRFVIRWQNGKLNVLPMRRNPLMYVLSDLIEDGALGLEERGEDYATAGTVRATVKGGKGKPRKITVTAQNAAAVRKGGFVHKNIDVGDVKDEADAREKLKRRLIKVSQRKRTLTGLQHPGIPFIRRGDAITVPIPTRGLTQARSVCWVAAGSWTLSGGDFQMSLDLTYDDPYATTSAARKAKDKKTRAKKRSGK